MRKDRRPIPTGNQNYIYAQFTFTPDWDRLSKTAVFYKKDIEPANCYIDDDACQIPKEFMETPGVLEVSVFAGDRRTVNTANVEIIQSGYREALPPAPPLPESVYVQSPDSSIPYLGYDEYGFWFESDGERKHIVVNNEEETIEIIPANLISDDIENVLILGTDDKLYVPMGAIPRVLYLDRSDSNAVFTTEKPTLNKTVIDRVWRPAIWGQWLDVATLHLDETVLRTEADVVIGSIFTAKLWLSSDVTVPNAQLQLTVTDISDNTDIAIAFTEINLNNVNTNLIPATFINKFRVTRQVNINQIQIKLSVMVTASGTQFGVVNNLPAQISFSTIMSASSVTGQTETNESLIDRISSIEERFARIPVVYHTSLITNLQTYEVPVVNLNYIVQRHGTNNIRLYINSISGTTLTTVKRSSQWDATYVEGQTIENQSITSTFKEIDNLVYPNSTEMHRTWIRQQHPISKLWSLHEVCLFASMDASFIDIWVYKIYDGYSK